MSDDDTPKPASPEHQCGGPREACCVPGCPECGYPRGGRHRDDLQGEAAEFVAHRCFTGWDRLVAERDAARAEAAELRKWGAFAVLEFEALRLAYNAIAQKPPPALGSHVPKDCAVLVKWQRLTQPPPGGNDDE